MPANAKLKAYRYGIFAEQLAAYYLRVKGYRILARRYRNPLGEIDIVARRGNTVVLVEVKARKRMGDCNYTITPRKQQMILRSAEGLLAGYGKITGLAKRNAHNIRFDVIWLAPWCWPVHIKDAFQL
ncbi:MAG: YraN family protein [Rickettsiales bacterium]|nr:YraN family protein [Rickettsiales bacterium]